MNVWCVRSVGLSLVATLLSACGGGGGSEGDDGGGATPSPAPPPSAGSVQISAPIYSASEADANAQSCVKASNTDASDNFGYAVSLSGDGQTLAIGAPNEQGAATGLGGDQADDSASEAGAVYLY